MCEYSTEGSNTAIWLIDFENPHLTGVGKYELNTWEWENSKVENSKVVKPIPYISNDKFSQEGIFQNWTGRLSGHAHVNQVYHDIVRMWRQIHGCPASGSGIERAFFSDGKQHDALKKKTMDKTLESTLKTSINRNLPTCDDKGVFTDDDDRGTYRKRK